MPPNQNAEQRELYKLVIAAQDFQEADLICMLLSHNKITDTSALYRPLLNALIVSYVRPFKRNKPVGPLDSKWHKWYGGNENWLHKQLIGLRDTAVAHSDSAMHKVRVYPAGTKLQTETVIEIWSGDLKPERIPQIKVLCEELLKRIETRIEELKKYLYPHGKIPPNGEYWELTPPHVEKKTI